MGLVLPPPTPMPLRRLRAFILRAVPVSFATVLAASTVGGLATQFDGPYRLAAWVGAVLLVGTAVHPHSLRLRLVAATMASLAWLGRLAWFIVQDVQQFQWSSTYAALVLLALLLSLMVWVMAADWLVVRGAE